jgi:FtsZ-binding cell division protein ZapB
MYSLRHRRAAHSGSMRTPIRHRRDNVPDGRDVKTEPTAATADELALKLPILEAENLGLRQLLAEVRANRDELRQEIDDLRQDRDHWQKLAKQPGPEGMGRRAWFCGRASPSN